MAAQTSNITVVITCYNQGGYVGEAVESARGQTLPPRRIIVVDDGSDDQDTIDMLAELERPRVLGEATTSRAHIPTDVIHQRNMGVSAARNTGIAAADTALVAVLDGDDRLLPTFLERTMPLLLGDEHVVAASGWMRTFGALESVVRPSGGGVVAFLPRNCCPASCLLRRAVFERSGGYDEDMRQGFEDWDCFLGMLEAAGPDARIEIVQEPLLEYRTTPQSSNVTSMDHRLELIQLLVERHRETYRAHVAEALIGVEATSIARLTMWERAMHDEPALLADNAGSRHFMHHPTYGDGGMAAAVRLSGLAAQQRQSTVPPH